MRNKLFKKIVAVGMAATMLLGMGLVSCAEESTTYTSAKFYAYYDADDDGADEWALAPYGMDDGNIVSVSHEGDEVVVNMNKGTYNIEMGFLGTVNMDGYIYELTGTGITVTKWDSSYSTPMAAQVTLDLSQKSELNGMTGFYATLSAKAIIGGIVMTPPGNMGQQMQVFLALE